VKVYLTYEQIHDIVQSELLDAIEDIRLLNDDPGEILPHAVAMAKYYHPVSKWKMIEELAYGKG
jgi:hypothetical protein